MEQKFHLLYHFQVSKMFSLSHSLAVQTDVRFLDLQKVHTSKFFVCQRNISTMRLLFAS